MRIISGTYKSRRIKPPLNLSVRPTTDAAKESLFNILVNYFSFSEVAFLDLFAGTGNITYEAASRGCVYVESVEENYKCTAFIKSTVAELEMEDVHIVKSDVFRYLEDTGKKFDIIFADPPYRSQNTYRIHELVFDRKLLKNDGFLILEHGSDQNFANLANLRDKRVIGNVNFTIFNQ